MSKGKVGYGEEIRIEEWCGYEIRFIKCDGEWMAILKDVCDALNLRTDAVANRLDSDMLERVKVVQSNPVRNGDRSRGENKTRWMLAVNELGIYEALFASKRLEARKFRRWSASVLQKLRNTIGLADYEALRLTEEKYQDQIDTILESLFWDEENKCVMRSVTVAGGDTDQIIFSK